MGEQLPDGRAPGRRPQDRFAVPEAVQHLDGGELGAVVLDRCVEVEGAAFALLEGGHGADDLCHGRDPEDAVGGRPGRCGPPPAVRRPPRRSRRCRRRPSRRWPGPRRCRTASSRTVSMLDVTVGLLGRSDGDGSGPGRPELEGDVVGVAKRQSRAEVVLGDAAVPAPPACPGGPGAVPARRGPGSGSRCGRGRGEARRTGASRRRRRGREARGRRRPAARRWCGGSPCGGRAGPGRPRR